MDYFIVALAAIFVAILTFFSGFGLGTLLMPVFTIFFPIETAIAATAMVHLANGLFKIGLVGKHASWPVVLKFGLIAILFALLGALALDRLTSLEPVAKYQLAGKQCMLTWIGIVLGALIAIFAIMEIFGIFEKLKFSRRLLLLGGALSGFFGGLSGHQGALRTSFLIHCGLTKQAFIATAVVCSVLVDLMRSAVYIGKGRLELIDDNHKLSLVVTGIFAAFLGSYIGSRFINKVTMKTIRRLVGVLLLILAVVIGSGLLV